MTIQLAEHMIDNAYEIIHPENMSKLKERMDDGNEYRFKRCIQAYESIFQCVNSLEDTFQDDSEVLIKECDVNSNKKKSNAGRKPKAINNQVRYLMLTYTAIKDIPVEVMNILEGIARFDWYSRQMKNENVIAPLPSINYSPVPFKGLYKECDVNSSLAIEGFLSPAGETRKQYLIGLHKNGNADALSVSKIVRCLKKLDEICTTRIKSILGINKRQAQRYVKALEIAMPYLVLAFEQTFERQAKLWVIRRRKFLASEGIFISTQHDEEMHLKNKFDNLMINAIGGVESLNYSEYIEGVYVPYEGIKIGKFRPDFIDEKVNESSEQLSIENPMAA